jgi:hypothetical protein
MIGSLQSTEAYRALLLWTLLHNSTNYSHERTGTIRHR